MRHPLADGYVIRAPRADDLESVYALVVATEMAEFGESTGFSLDDLRDQWDDADLERCAWVAMAPDGSHAGYCLLGERRHVRMDAEGYIHPDHVGRGIGTTFVRLSEARAREHVTLAPPNARVVINNWINALNQDASALLEREGYTPVRYFWQMEAGLDDARSDPSWPNGIAVVSMAGEQDMSTFYRTLHEAMSDHWGHIPISFEAWKQKHMRGGFDPSLWFLALEGSEPAGAAKCSVSDGVGWVDTLGVRRDWRRQGLGLALLRHAACEFHRRGLKRYALGVDTESATGATRLYERAGMHVAQQHATWGKELHPGDELTETNEPEAAEA